VFIHFVISAALLFAFPATTGQSVKFKQVKAEGNHYEYVSSNGERFAVDVTQTASEAKAYEMLSLAAAEARVEIGNAVGTAEFSSKDQITFFKGNDVVRISSVKPDASLTSLNDLATSLSETLDKGDGDIPVLIKHLPNPDEAQKNAIYLNSFDTLTSLAPQQPVLTAVKAGGNADATLASIGTSKMLLIEFNTPQLATENDERIIARIHELWNLGQPAPTAYRRVGNYSVFVFDAPDEQTAKQLIDQVKYEQVVSWLGENPNILRRAEERYINTTLGVLVAVLKASGYALVGCFGIGGLIGALLFTYRRSQQKAVTAYSDAGGMLRLNLDELTATDTRKLNP
jgi:uncharacterized protein DUF6599